MSRLWAVVLAGGASNRFGVRKDQCPDISDAPDARPKQFLDLGGRSLLAASVSAAASVADGVVVVLPDLDLRWDPPDLGIPLIETRGGVHRADSVRSGLARVPRDCRIIVIADAAHPMASPALFARVVQAVEAGADGAIPGLPLTEALIRVAANGTRVAGLPREGLELVQMPHAFRADILRRVHADGPVAVEDSQLVAAAGGRVVVIPGEPSNLHVTTPAELAMARRLCDPWPQV